MIRCPLEPSCWWWSTEYPEPEKNLAAQMQHLSQRHGMVPVLNGSRCAFCGKKYKVARCRYPFNYLSAAEHWIKAEHNLIEFLMLHALKNQ